MEKSMKERPILFNGPMVRALLDGSKTQTRRALNPQPVWQPNWGTSIGMNGAWRVGSPAAMGLSERGDHWSATFDEDTRRRYAKEEAYGWGARAGCPYGQPGDQLWVRETFVTGWSCIDGDPEQFDEDGNEKPEQTWYRATTPALEWNNGDGCVNTPWKPSIHMPRANSRITLEVVSVRVERLQDISEADALAEGVRVHQDHHGKPRTSIYSPVQAYHDLWESINGPGSWDAAPWVWAVEFRRLP